MKETEIKKIIEALLFASPIPLTQTKVNNVFNPDTPNLKKIVEIGSQPLSGIFLKSKRYNLTKYPLNLYKCKKCDLVQLLKSPGKDKMFGDSYEYKTSLSLSMKNHIEKKASYLKEKKFINKY